jgi:HJR/Mrr/RecB family endonuclease
VGPEEFRQTMVTYFSQKGFTSTHVTREQRVIDLVAY